MQLAPYRLQYGWECKMDKAEFDKFAEEYDQMLRENIRITGEGPEYFAEYKVRDIRNEIAADSSVGEPKSILDFGGGIGESTPYLARHFPQSDIINADVSERSLKIAQRHDIRNASTLLFDGSTLPLPDDSQDVVLAACVFHHIPADQHEALFAEIRRVLTPGGSLFVFEHNPWNPLTVRAVNTCPFDENAVLITAPTLRRRVLAGGFVPHKISVRFRIFFPHILKSLRRMESYMTGLPLGAQYYLRAVK